VDLKLLMHSNET